TETLADNPKLGKALVGAWYEMMGLMHEDADIRAKLGKAAGTDLAGYDAQLATTRMFYAPAEAVSFTESADLVATMDAVRKFSDAHGLLGESGQSVDAVGIAFPGGKTLGDTANIRLRFDPAFMAQAASGGL
ncbi:MAG TPA: lipid kinase, partial [Alphaproteobacteria bacterium]|nr:lipid kinase [Alphaproteobacteria bacterium]